MSLRTVARRFAVAGISLAVIAGTASTAATAAPSPQSSSASTIATLHKKFAGITPTSGARGIQAQPGSVGSRLTAGQSFGMGTAHMESPSGQHIVTVNGYLGAQYGLIVTGYTGDPVVLSMTGVASAGQATNMLAMQGDGNLVLYTNGKPTFSTNTWGHPGAFVQLQDDRNLVVYGPDNKPLWASNTVMDNMSSFYIDPSNNEQGELDPGWTMQSSGARKYKMIMQPDGNLVLYSPTRAIWASGTNGNPGATAILQADGNLVIYNAAHTRALWSSGTSRSVVGANVLIVQPDGNVVLYFQSDTSASVRWSTRTYGVS